MKASFLKTVGRLWLGGGLMLVLRAAQNRVGFDSEGLAVPNLPGTLLIGCVVAVFLLEFALTFRLSKAIVPFSEHFAPPEKSLMAGVCGCMLLIFGGGLLVMETLQTGFSVAPMVAGVLGVLSGMGLLPFLRQMKAGEADSVLPLLPLLFFGVFLVLAIYLSADGDPVLARFYLQVLASAMVAFAFAQFSGFLQNEGSRRRFTPVADLAVMLSIAAITDGSIALALLFGGCALLLSVFLWLQRDTSSPA